MGKRILCILVAAFVLASIAVGCGAQTGTAANGNGTGSAAVSDKPDPNELYIGVYCLGNLEYFYDHKIGLKAAGEAMGVKTKYVGPPQL